VDIPSVAALWRRRPGWPQRFRARGRNVVVLYHRIARQEAPDELGMVVDSGRLERQLRALADHFDVVPAAEVLRPRSRPAAAITFDDGYLDNLTNAVPVLRALGLPATFFVVSDAMDGGTEFWWDQLEHLLLDDERPRQVTVVVGGRPRHLDLRDGAGRVAALRDLGGALVGRPAEEIRAVLGRLSGGTPARACGRHARLDAAQVAALGADPLFDVGSHTCTHSALRPLSRRGSRRELEGSRDRLAEVLGAAPRLVAYPYGARGTLRRRDAAHARRAGYDLGFVNVTGPAEGSNPYAVPRVTVGEWEPDVLLRNVTRWTR
jgi:peptidoglycan/xylan/chitin deacetylase (PgdA/CDA1 family)